jgi:uncharacterized membrane protein YjfL (UPF0719 family)
MTSLLQAVLPLFGQSESGFQQYVKPGAVVGSILYVLIGLVFFGLSFWIIQKVTPFSIRKEIEDDQNTALAIIIGSVILGIAIIIGAAIHG